MILSKKDFIKVIKDLKKLRNNFSDHYTTPHSQITFHQYEKIIVDILSIYMEDDRGLIKQYAENSFDGIWVNDVNIIEGIGDLYELIRGKK